MVRVRRRNAFVKDILNSTFARAVVRFILPILFPFVNTLSVMHLYKPNIFVQNGKMRNVLNENYAQNAIITLV